MAVLINATTGQICGHFGDNDPVPAGFWTLPDTTPTQLDLFTFLTLTGHANFGAILSAVIANPMTLGFPFFSGFAADTIYLEQAYPATLAFEQAGVLPPGTAQAIWNQ